jgi:hypothetical protein
MSDVDLIIGVHVNGASEIANLSASLRALTANLRGINIPMSKMDAHTKALNKALGGASKSAGEHAKSLKELAKNQKVIAEEAKRVKSNIDSYRTAIQMAGGTNTKFGKELRGNQKDLEIFGRQLRGLKIRAFGSDLRSASMHIQKIGKDAQFVGRSLMINLTAPILLFGRLGFSSLLAVNREAVRLTKVLENVAMSAEQANRKLTGGKGGFADPKAVQQLIDNFNELDRALTKISTDYGVSKEIVVGLASDFAELGISSKESLTQLVELTTRIEKLGSMDIGPAKDLAQALYFQSRRALEANGAFNTLTKATQRNERAIGSATTQLNMFNAIENVTALSLQDLAASLPEVGSMAVSFGLSMTEAAALLAPMKAAGLDVGASANSIKVSLQRALAPTKKNIDFLAGLAKQYGVTSESQKMFNEATKTGLTGLQAIVDIFDTVQNSAAGAEGALFLMSQLFEKRQGPRMYLAIQELAAFNKELNSVTRQSGSAEAEIAGVAETALRKFNALNKTALPVTINNFTDIGRLARIATAVENQKVEGFGIVSKKDIETAKLAREEISKYVLKRRQLDSEDLIGNVKTEAGKALMVELIGSYGAAQIADNELKMSLASTSVATERLRNAFKLFAADLIRAVGPAIQKVADYITKLYEKWQNTSEQIKNRVRIAVVAFLGLLAALGPLVLALGTFQASVGVMGRAVSFFIPKLKQMDNTFLGIISSAKKAATAVGEYTKVLAKKQAVIPAEETPGGLIGLPKRIGKNIAFSGAVKPKLEDISLFADSDPRKAEAIARNRAKILEQNVAKNIAKQQYLRNEASIMASQGLKFNKTGQIINTSTGRFATRSQIDNIAKASTLREGRILESGIKTSRKGIRSIDLLGGRTVKLAEDDALKIARGGIRGAIAKQAVSVRDIGSRFTSATGVTGRGFIRGMFPGGDVAGPLKPTSFRPGALLTSAKNAGRLMLPSGGKLVSDTGVANVKGIAKAAFNAGPVAAYTKSVNGAKAAVKAMQFEQSALGGSAGKIKTLTTAMGGFMRATKLGTIAIKLMKFAMVSSGIGALVLAVGVAAMLVVKNFDQFKKSAGSAFTGLKNALGTLKDAAMALIEPILNLFSTFSKSGDSVDGVAGAFKGIVKVIQFVARVVKEFVIKYVQPYMYAIMNIVAAVVSAFQGNWGKAFDFLVAAVSWAGKLVVNIFAGILKGAVTIVAIGIKGIIGYFTLIPKLLAKTLGFFGKWVPGLSAIGNAINTVIDGAFSLVDKGKNAVTGAIDSAANFISSGLDKGAKKGISKTKQTLGKGKNDTKKEAGELGEAIANATGEGFNKAEDLGKRVAEAVIDAAQQLQDYVAGELKNAISKYVDESIKALNKQKDSALKVFDVQLSTLTKLEKAEESLTRTKEYEAKKRKLIDDKSLSDEQFRRNIAVAIYEGRIDDARMLQLEQKASEKNFGEELKTIESDRAKDLAKENLEALKDAINEAKDAASKFFDESIEKFKTAIEEITKFPPITIDDYKQQTEKIMTFTKASAEANGVEFAKMFDSFATSINEKMPNSVIGAFATNLDELVMTAKEKYGLGADSSENTIIGATIGMLADIGGVFGDRKQEVIDAFGTVTTGLKTNLTDTTTALVKKINEDFFNPFNTAIETFVTNWKEIYTKAIEDGNQSITDSLRNNVKINKDLLEEMRKNLSDTTLKWLEMKAAAEQAADAAANANNAADGGPSGVTSSNKTPTRPNLYYGSADTYEARMALLRNINRTTSPLNKTVGQFAKGGKVSANTSASYMPSGFIAAPTQEGVPALLHGGEYIINAKAVSRIGVGALNKLNNNLIPQFAKGGQVPAKGKLVSSKKGDGTLNGPYGTVLKPIVPGNIDLNRLPLVKNNLPGEGGISTVRSIGVGTDFGTILLPTVINGKILNDKAAIDYGIKNNKNLGIYANDAAAGMAAQLIHLSEENRVNKILTSTKNITNKNIIADRAEQAINKRTNDALKQKAMATARIAISNQPYDWKKDENRNLISDTINRGIDVIAKTGLFETKNFFETIGAIAGTTFGGKPGAIAGSSIGRATGSFFEQLIDDKKGISNKAIAKEAGFGGLHGAIGVGIDAVLGKVVSKVAPKIAAKLLPRFINNPSLSEINISRAVPEINIPKTNAIELYRGPLIPQVISKPSIIDGDRIITESLEMYKIGTEHVAFGAKGIGGWNTSIPFKSIEINPYEISGLSERTVVGQKLANEWIKAHTAYAQETGNATSNYVDALLYAFKNGDIKAGLEFKRLAQSGANAVSIAKQEFDSVPMDYLTGAIQRGRLEDLTLDDMFIVHETKFKPPVDKFGNIVLKPTSDYQTIFNDAGEQFELVRDTIHFSLNHLVTGHMQRENISNAHIIVSKLKDVLDANPGALDNLYPVDTWFTPKPGEGLVIPKGSFETFIGDTNPAHKVNESMKRMLGERYRKIPYLFQGGEHGSATTGADQLARVFAKELGVTFGPHFDRFAYNATQASNIRELGVNAGGMFSPYSLVDIGGENAISRFLTRNGIFTGIKKEIKWSDAGMRRFKTGGYVPGMPSTPVPAILHGGEYVVNANAVKNMGIRTMESINQSRFRTPSGAPGVSGYGQTTSVSTVNINVDTFIGEEEWFKTMMKSYNLNVLPKNQKLAGNEGRIFTSYNGINQGM